MIVFFVCATVKAQTQLEINEKNCNEYKKADEQLNKVYGQILSKYKDDKLFIDKLKIAEKAWITFRDAHLDSIFPENDKQLNYGSVYPTCRCIELTEITEQRIRGHLKTHFLLK
jgi:uncharacterized protein YecT (DUF1311 family)